MDEELWIVVVESSNGSIYKGVTFGRTGDLVHSFGGTRKYQGLGKVLQWYPVGQTGRLRLSLLESFTLSELRAAFPCN